MSRDDVDVPPIMVKCCEAIEKHGLNFQGIYRVGGTVTKVAKLREMLDKGLCHHGSCDTPLTSGSTNRSRFCEP